VEAGQNDGRALLGSLAGHGPVDGGARAAPAGSHVPAVLSALRGPWALVFWQAAEGRLWFGRDAVGARLPSSLAARALRAPGTREHAEPDGRAGRRSLLVHYPDSVCSSLALTSVSPGPSDDSASTPGGPYGISWQVTAQAAPRTRDARFGPASLSSASEHATWCPAPQELPPGLYSLGLGSASAPHAAVQRHAWTDPLWDHLSAYRRAPDATCPGSAHDEAALQAAAAHIHDLLAHAVAVRCCCVEERSAAISIATPGNGDAGREPAASSGAAEQAQLPPARILVLFSGGVDSSLLAALAHRALPPAEPIDLACVCFDAGRSPDRRARPLRRAPVRARGSRLPRVLLTQAVAGVMP